MKKIALLGSTGSIGTSVLDVVRKFPDDYAIVSMAAGRNISLFACQIEEFAPQLVSVERPEDALKLEKMLPDFEGEILYGAQGNQAVAAHEPAHITISAIVGAAGLLPTLAAIEAGKDIGLANKETLVMAGKIVMEAVARKGVALLPVDSEHSAIFQGFHGGRKEDLEKIIITASGGPFHGRTKSELKNVTRAQALAHPNWEMGEKISIDSATLMNKGLEVIEAKWLFDLDLKEIEVVVHPQSIVHSLVEFHDGSMIGHLGTPDMCIPIGYALSFPNRLPLELKKLSLAQCGRLDFTEPDYENFPALRLAFTALERGGVAPAVLNAANEVAVAAFLAEKIGFLEIVELVAITLDRVVVGDENKLDDILAADKEARIVTTALIENRI